MQEFTTVSSSSFDPSALATKLTEKSADGWSVVNIVSTGGDVTAFLSRPAGSVTASAAAEPAVVAAVVADAVVTPAPTPEPAPEPAGWAAAPEPAPVAPIVEPMPTYTPAPVYTPAPAAAAAVPAGWYADPAGRFELRYWDGGTWSEHVSRAGQQFTDPPVA
ncbi:MAG: hypothetical protein RLZZ623_300 [Actinomycetota bacterium]|jgi:Protein of unknown function (DUF2510)